MRLLHSDRMVEVGKRSNIFVVLQLGRFPFNKLFKNSGANQMEHVNFRETFPKI